LLRDGMLEVKGGLAALNVESAAGTAIHSVDLG
jgi:hypothetical protein